MVKSQKRILKALFMLFISTPLSMLASEGFKIEKNEPEKDTTINKSRQPAPEPEQIPQQSQSGTAITNSELPLAEEKTEATSTVTLLDRPPEVETSEDEPERVEVISKPTESSYPKTTWTILSAVARAAFSDFFKAIGNWVIYFKNYLKGSELGISANLVPQLNDLQKVLSDAEGQFYTAHFDIEDGLLTPNEFAEKAFSTFAQLYDSAKKFAEITTKYNEAAFNSTRTPKTEELITGIKNNLKKYIADLKQLDTVVDLTNNEENDFGLKKRDNLYRDLLDSLDNIGLGTTSSDTGFDILSKLDIQTPDGKPLQLKP